MHNKKRIRVDCFFSVKKENSETIKSNIGKALSTKYGGCSFADMQGIWRGDGNQSKVSYTEVVETSLTIHLILCLLPSKKDECLQEIKSIFKKLSEDFDDFSAIHVETINTEAHHFIV